MSDYAFVSAAAGIEVTGAFDTSLGTIIIVGTGWHSTPNPPVDNKGNTSFGILGDDHGTACSPWHVLAPSGLGVGTIWSASMPSTGSLAVLVFKNGSNSVDQNEHDGTGSAVTSFQSAAAPVRGVSMLAIAMLATDGSPTGISIDSGFTIPAGGSFPAVSGNNYGITIAYKRNPDIGIVQPTWSWTNAVQPSTTLTIFGRPDNVGELKTVEGQSVVIPVTNKTIEGINLSQIQKFEGFRP